MVSKDEGDDSMGVVPIEMTCDDEVAGCIGVGMEGPATDVDLEEETL